jgi:glycosyltransferase involved in cell wall biosynthesis
LRICFDTQIFCAQEVGGISRYFSSMAKSMQMLPDVRPSIVAPLHINAYLERLPAGLVRGRRLRLHRAPPLIRAASILSCSVVQYLTRPDIIHRTYYYPVPRAPHGARTVLTVYDMIHEKFPQDFPAHDPIRNWKAHAVARADHVICISENTRRDLLALHDIPPERVSVIHLSHDSLAELPGDEPAAAFRHRLLGADVPYLLYVGSRAPYKNFTGLVAAYAASPWLRDSFRLLSFGGGPFSAAEEAMLVRAGVAQQVTQISGADALLANCYRHAALFVYPSLYEGFGLPPLEAMSLDCPVACSNSSSIPEVVGDAAALFDPLDPDSIRTVLERVLSSDKLLGEYVTRGALRSRLFCWDRCAQETIDVYQRTLAA